MAPAAFAFGGGGHGRVVGRGPDDGVPADDPVGNSEGPEGLGHEDDQVGNLDDDVAHVLLFHGGGPSSP